VVNDDELMRRLVRRGLERDGFHVWLASNGPEAIHLYRKHRDTSTAPWTKMNCTAVARCFSFGLLMK
jgi:CheY-like chemotaxis protein